MPETTVGIREFKSGFSSYLRQVKSGASLVITERGKPVGQLVPVRPSIEERLAQLTEANVIAWDGRKLPPSVPRVPLRGSQTVSEILLEDRE
ncbi:MAG: type II toxin-antitoxin system prevent-host-death family antitoxin [bacterium]|nr:type II toxin-antitoxin system prevent-host-death family antitoxin [bacterium]